MRKQVDAKLVLALAIIVLFWASAFAGIRIGLRSYSPGHLVLFRFGVASVVLGVYALATRMRLPDARDLPVLALVGVTGITLYQLLLTHGEVTVTAGTASFLIATAPIFTALLAVVFGGERLKPLGWVAIGVSFLGGALIAWGESGGFRFSSGALMVLGAAVCTGMFNVLQKPLLRKYDPLVVTSFAIWIATLCLLIYVPGVVAAVRRAPLNDTLAVIYLGILPAALTYVLWSYLLSRLPASIVGGFTYLIAPLATVLGWVLLAEVPPLVSLMGGAISVGGVVLLNTRGR